MPSTRPSDDMTSHSFFFSFEEIRRRGPLGPRRCSRLFTTAMCLVHLQETHAAYRRGGAASEAGGSGKRRGNVRAVPALQKYGTGMKRGNQNYDKLGRSRVTYESGCDGPGLDWSQEAVTSSSPLPSPETIHLAFIFDTTGSFGLHSWTIPQIESFACFLFFKIFNFYFFFIFNFPFIYSFWAGGEPWTLRCFVLFSTRLPDIPLLACFCGSCL